MTEVTSAQPKISNGSASLQELIDRLKPLHIILSQNSYVKDTTRRLKRIIDDADNQPIFLFLGKERVGKTTLINSLLGRELLVDNKKLPTTINTFLRFGEEECIKAIFLDGMIATFDISKLHLLTVSDTYSAQIIREHLDFIEVYINHDLLKDVTLIDSTAIEVGTNNTAYFSHSLLQRVDEVFLVVRSDSPATVDEVNLINKLETFQIQPHVIVNGIDHSTNNVDQFVNSEKVRYGKQVGEFVAVSALNALQARKTNDTQLLIDSNVTQLNQLIYRLLEDKQKKIRHVTELFIQWLERLRKEIEVIPTREPYISALKNMEQYISETDYEFSRQQRDVALLTSYEEEYKNVSTVFKDVQTLYQLLQKLASDLYLRDSVVEKFEEMAVLYQKNVRDYRKIHVDYSLAYTQLEKHYKKLTGKPLAFPIAKNDFDVLLKEQINTLNKLQKQCGEKLELINQYEDYVCTNLYTVQNRLNELAAQRLKSIITQVSDLNLQRKTERVHIRSYSDKLAEFNCIVEAQGFLRDAIQPYFSSNSLPINEQEKKQIQNTIDGISAVEFTHQALYNQLTIAEHDDLLTQLEFESKYLFNDLSLTESDVKSDIPQLPNPIEI